MWDSFRKAVGSLERSVRNLPDPYDGRAPSPCAQPELGCPKAVEG